MALKSPGFDDAGWPRSMDPKDLIVDSLTFRIRVQPRLKVLPGESPDAPPTMEVRLQLFLELRPVFRTPGPKPTTMTTTAKPYDRRRRGHFDPAPPEVERWCTIHLVRVACGVWLRVLVNPLWTCVRCCKRVPRCGPCTFQCPPGSHLLSNSSDSEGSPSISYQVNGLPGVDLAAPGEPSELEWFAESPKWPDNLTIPAGFFSTSLTGAHCSPQTRGSECKTSSRPWMRRLCPQKTCRSPTATAPCLSRSAAVAYARRAALARVPTCTQKSYRTRAWNARCDGLIIWTCWPFPRRYVGLGRFVRLGRSASQRSPTESLRGGNIDRWCLH
mmetsp:Transcript_74018/g.176482  ORF Transcript_74018/g.176482 Transcript_74018/m.176482 type:complete len:329 (+) Transcript_74018:566-1552(+)